MKKGEKVIFWPIIGRFTNGKRTTTTSDSFKASSGHEVIFCDGISGYVSTKALTNTAPEEATFCNKFEHGW